MNNVDQLQREVRDKKRTIKQLRDLMYELDTLRTQVNDDDLDKFDTKTLSLRKILISIINGYLGMMLCFKNLKPKGDFHCFRMGEKNIYNN